MMIIVNFLLLLLRFVRVLIHPILVYNSSGKRKRLPPIKNELLFMSATELAKQIRRKQLSSQEACKAYIDRIKEVNPFVNAVVEDRFQIALEDATNVDHYLSKCKLSEEELEKTKPLLGVPLTVKESCGLEGMEYSVGYLPRAGIKAESDGEIVSRLKANGAIPLLVSNTPELCMSIETNNFITGRTNNAYDTTRTSGGSSGGEGALLGAGASVIGIGSDLAGSIRIPAMYNGVFGHKPSPRIATTKGHFSYHSDKFLDYLVIGPMTRYAQDLKLMMTHIIDPGQEKKLRLREKVDLAKLNVFFMVDADNCFLSGVENEIKMAMVTAAKYLETNFGAKVIGDKKFPVSDAITVCSKVVLTIKDMPSPLKAGEHLPIEFMKALIGCSKYTLNSLYLLLFKFGIEVLVEDMSKEVASNFKSIVDILGENGVFLFPTWPESASRHNDFICTSSFFGYTIFANAYKLPATSIPCGFDKKGMPIGIQVMAAPNQDRLCLAVAEELEKCFGGWKPPNEILNC